MNHPFNEEGCSNRLLEEYKKYNGIIVGIDFDNTIKELHKEEPCNEIVTLLKDCSSLPGFTLCLWSIPYNGKDLDKKVSYCNSLGIRIDYVNDSPYLSDKCRKAYFNILLDDRAGLESAYNSLKYVVEYVKSIQ